MADTPQMPAILTDAEIAEALRPLYQPEALAALVADDALMEDFRAVARAQAAKGVREALDGYAELLQAATNYVNRYALDEADDDGQYWTGCSEQQHKDAKRLLDAIRAKAAEIHPQQKADSD